MLKLYTRELLCGEKVIEDEKLTISQSNLTGNRHSLKVMNVYITVEKYFHDPFSQKLTIEKFSTKNS